MNPYTQTLKPILLGLNPDRKYKNFAEQRIQNYTGNFFRNRYLDSLSGYTETLSPLEKLRLIFSEFMGKILGEKNPFRYGNEVRRNAAFEFWKNKGIEGLTLDDFGSVDDWGMDNTPKILQQMTQDESHPAYNKFKPYMDAEKQRWTAGVEQYKRNVGVDSFKDQLTNNPQGWMRNVVANYNFGNFDPDIERDHLHSIAAEHRNPLADYTTNSELNPQNLENFGFIGRQIQKQKKDYKPLDLSQE